nr:ribonuclease H-like domain, reverse transcriptase, RNA-dependent DNA polymerase [Tanacetum cinerariifolium]
MLSMRVKQFYKKTRIKLKFNGKEQVGFDKTKVKCFNYHRRGHFASDCRTAKNPRIQETEVETLGMQGEEETDFALMAFTSNPSSLNFELDEALRENEDLKAKLEKFEPSSKNLTKLLNSQISVKVKTNPGYDNQFNEKEVLDVKEEEVTATVFDNRSSDEEHNLANDRFKKVASGSSRHMTGNKAYLADYQEINNGGFVAFCAIRVKITGKGKIKTVKLDFDDVYFVNELKFNLFFVSQMCDKQNSVLFTKIECVILSLNFKLLDESQVLLRIPKQSNMYSFDLQNIVPFGNLTCLFAKAFIDKSNLWYRRLGHVNFKTMNKLVKGHLVRGLPLKIFKNDYSCVACQKKKQHKATCKAKLVSSISQLLQMLHMDLLVQHLDLDEFYGMKEIKRKYSNARTPQQNKVAERKNMTLIEATRTMLADSLLPITFWAEAVNTACYVLNRALVTKLHNKTPYELLNGRSPRLDFMRPFSCPVTILNTLDPLGKFEGKADEGFLIGYSVTISVGNQTDKNASPQDTNGNTGTQDNVDVRKEVSDQHYIMLLVWSSISFTYKSSNDKAEDDKPKDNIGSKTVVDPVNKEDQAYKDALDKLMSQENKASDVVHSFSKEFEQGCMDQRGAAKAGNTNSFNTVSNPVNAASTLGTFSVGGPSYPYTDAFIPDDTLLHVDQDDAQIPDLEDTNELKSTGIFTSAYDDELDTFTSPIQSVGAEADFKNMKSSIVVSPIPTHRALVSYIYKQRRTNHKDHENCLFACFLSQMEPKKKVWRLVDLPYRKKAIRTKWVYKNKKDERGIVVRNKARLVAQAHRQEEWIDYDEVYVDDIIFGSTKNYLCDEFEAMMHNRLQMSSMGELSFFLGLQVKHSEEGIFISQDKYVAEILKNFEFSSVRSTSTPIETHKPLVKDKEAADVDVHLYRSVTPKLSHLHAMKRIFRYLKGQPKLGLWYPRDSPFDLEAYSDSDYTGANLDRKSTIGGCQFLGRRLITWQCKKQTIVATSTTEAEYVVAANCCGQGKNGDKLVSAARQSSLLNHGRSCTPPQYNMVAYLEKTKGNAEFHQIVDFLSSSSIHHALTGEGSGSGPGHQETMGGAMAHIKFKGAPIQFSDPPLSTGNTVGSGKDRMEHAIELTDLVLQTPYDSPLSGELVPPGDTVWVGGIGKKGGSTAKTVSTARPNISAARTEVSTAELKTPPTTTTSFDDKDVTISDTLVKMKSQKAKEKEVAFKDVNDSDRPIRSITTLQPLPTINPKDNGKGNLQEPEPVKKIKKRDQDQIERDVEVALKIQAELDEEAMTKRERQKKASKAALAELYDVVQAQIDDDHELAARLTYKEQEKYTVKERSKLLAEFFERRKTHIAKEREEVIRSKPPTKTQLRNLMMTYLKHTCRFTHAQLQSRSFEDAFIPIGSKEDEKRVGSRKKRAACSSSKQKSHKKKKVNDQEFIDSDKELKKWLKVILDDDKAINYETLDVKSLIVDCKSQVLGTMVAGDVHVYKLTRLDRSYRHFLTFSRMLEVLDRQDVLDLHKIVMERFSANDPKVYDLILYGDLKTLMESSEDDEIWINNKIISY